MTNPMKAAMAAMLMVGTVAAQAQTTTTKAPAKKVTKKATTESSTARELHELREKQAAQQAEIDKLMNQLAAKDAVVATAQQDAAAAQTAAQTATAQAQSVTATVQANTDAVQALKSNVTDLQTANTGLATTISANKLELTEKIESPSTLHYKGITITPVAFFAFEGVWRQRSVNSDINTPFNSIPFPSANEGHVSELNFSGRQSRLGGLFEGQAKGFKLSGYFEADFLGTGTSSNNNQSNSYVLRQRQVWAKAETSKGFAVTGGQMWSLVTENGKATNARTEKLPNTIDPQYMVGFSWTRQPGIRIQQTIGDLKKTAVTVAASVEQAQITSFTANGAIPVNFFFAGGGTNGGLYNAGATYSVTGGTASLISNYANNVAPDVIAKVAVDFPKAHIEVGGIGRFLRDYYFPITSPQGSPYTYAANYISSTKAAGGVFGSVRVSPSKYLDVAVQAMGGTGVGRYGSSQLADATLYTDGSLDPISNYHGMGSLESHPTKKLDVFAYYGGEYAQRTVFTSLSGSLMGYGIQTNNNSGCYNLPTNNTTNNGIAGTTSATGTCQAPTKYIQEGMIGFTYRIVNSPKYGRLQYSATYQYIQRQLWAGIGSATTPVSPRAEDGMIHVGMRYYIP